MYSFYYGLPIKYILVISINNVCKWLLPWPLCIHDYEGFSFYLLMARNNKLYEELKIRIDAWLLINVYCRSPSILCLYRQKTVQHWTEEAQSRPLLGRWWVVMSTALYPIGCRRLLDLQPWGHVTLWGHCMGSTCRWNGLKRLRSEGDMSGQASLKEREKDVERLEPLIGTISSGHVNR